MSPQEKIGKSEEFSPQSTGGLALVSIVQDTQFNSSIPALLNPSSYASVRIHINEQNSKEPITQISSGMYDSNHFVRPLFGQVIAIKLKPGDYYIDDITTYRTGAFTNIKGSTKGSSEIFNTLHNQNFTIEPGKITYLGRLRLKTNERFGFENRLTRDLPVLKREKPKIHFTEQDILLKESL